MSNISDYTTNGGVSFSASPYAGPQFLGFLNQLQDAGAPVGSVGGYNYRNIAGTNKLSQHAFGDAIDIDQGGRNISPKLQQWAQQNPEAFRAALGRWGLVSGGDWHNPDFGHFELANHPAGAPAPQAPGGPGGVSSANGQPQMSDTNGYGPALAQLMQQQNPKGPLDDVPVLGRLLSSNNANGMSPLERAGIYLMGINNPSALGALGQGNKANAQHLQMMQWLMGHQQNQQNADRAYNLQLQNKDIAQQDFDLRRTDTARERQDHLAEQYDKTSKIETDNGPRDVPEFVKQGFDTNPYRAGGKLFQDFGGRAPTPVGPGGAPMPRLPVPPPSPQALAPQAAPVPPTASAGPAYASVAAPPPQAPPSPQAPPAPPQPVAPQAPPPVMPQASAAPEDNEEGFSLPVAKQVAGENAKGTTKQYADAISAYRQQNPNATMDDIIKGIAKTEPALADYLRSAKDGSIDPSKTFRGKNQEWMANAQQLIPSALGQDPDYIASKFADNKKFREENLDVNKPGSIGFKLQGVRNMADQIIDQNKRFDKLGNAEGNPNTPAWAQEGVSADLPILGHVGTPNLNSHMYSDSGSAKSFNTYEQTLGNENNKFMVPGQGNGTGAERSTYMHAVDSSSKPSTYYEQRQRMDQEGRNYLEEAKVSVAQQFGANSSQYKDWIKGTYAPTLKRLDEASADTEKRFGQYSQENREKAAAEANKVPVHQFQGPSTPTATLNSIAHSATPMAPASGPAQGPPMPPTPNSVAGRLNVRPWWLRQ